MDATWHARPRGSATWAHAAPTRRDVHYLYLLIYDIIYKSSVYRKRLLIR